MLKLFISLFFLTTFNSWKLHATTSLGLGIVEWDAYGNNYKGCKVSFAVQDEGKDLWAGQLTFSPLGVKVGITNGRTQFNPSIKLQYIHTDRLSSVEGDFKCEPLAQNASTSFFTDRNLISWTIPSVITIDEVIDTVRLLRDAKGKYPKYKFFGYDCKDNVANCATFACRFLEKIGIEMRNASELYKWCYPGDGFGLGTFFYYTIGFGSIRDNVQALYVVSELNKHKNKLVWKWKGNQALPVFKESIIENAFGKDFSKKLTY